MSGTYRLVWIEPDGTSTVGVDEYGQDEIGPALADAYNSLPENSRIEFTTEPPLEDAWAYAVPAQTNLIITQGAKR